VPKSLILLHAYQGRGVRKCPDNVRIGEYSVFDIVGEVFKWLALALRVGASRLSCPSCFGTCGGFSCSFCLMAIAAKGLEIIQLPELDAPLCFDEWLAMIQVPFFDVAFAAAGRTLSSVASPHCFAGFLRPVDDLVFLQAGLVPSGTEINFVFFDYCLTAISTVTFWCAIVMEWFGWFSMRRHQVFRTVLLMPSWRNW
jgi:hypothetical protein